jgi:oligopeptidase B
MYAIPPEKTTIYGRSAGGLLVGGTLTNHPDGSLMGSIYTEVPYVDELRTTTNSDLPLTVLEYDEFGNPRDRLEDFLSVGLLSPADSATIIKTPSIFVFARTAAHDSQVFAYEPLKWIRRLRKSGGAPKICIVDRNAGHFTAPDTQLQQWSLDCAILDSWTSASS